MEKQINAGQKSEFIRPEGRLGNTGAKAARKTGLQPQATAAVRSAINTRLTDNDGPNKTV